GARLHLLHHALQDALRAGAVDLDLDVRVGGFEQLGYLLRARQHQRRVPDDLALFAGAFEMLAGCLGVAADDEAGDEDSHRHDEPADESSRHRWASGVSAEVRSLRLDAPGSARTAAMIASARAAGSASPALPRNFASISALVSGASGPPRGRSCRSRSRRPSASVTSTSPTNWRG